MPAIAEADAAPQRGVAGAAHPDRRMRLLHRRDAGNVLEANDLPLVGDESGAGPQSQNGAETVVGQRAAPPVGLTEGSELVHRVTDADAQNEAPATEGIDVRPQARGQN